MEKLNDMVRNGDGDQNGAVHPTGPDIYLAFRQWSIEPALILDAGKSYRLHAMSMDAVHSITLLDRELMLEPDHEATIVFTAPEAEVLPVQCGEFCGNGHSRMTEKIQIRPAR